MRDEELIGRVVNDEQPLRIEILEEHGVRLGYLAPLTRRNLVDGELIQKLTAWRNHARKWFFSQRTVTCGGTKAWLEQVILKEPKHLFFVIHSENKPAGTIAFHKLTDGMVEIGNLIRGERIGHPQLMHYTVLTLVDWMFAHLDIDRIVSYHLANNWLSYRTHDAIGFKATQRIPLTVEIIDGERQLRMCTAGSGSTDGLYAQQLELARSQFLARKKQNALG